MEIRRRVRPGVDFAKRSDRHFRVNLRGVEPRVSKQLLDQADVRAVLQHVRGAAVAEQVATASFTDVGGLDRFRYPVADISRTHALPVAAEEKGLFGCINDQPRTGSFKVSFDPLQGRGADRCHAPLAALPLADVDRLRGYIEVADIERGQLTAAHAGRVKGFEDRTISDAERIGYVGDIQNGADVLQAQAFGQAARRLAG